MLPFDGQQQVHQGQGQIQQLNSQIPVTNVSMAQQGSLSLDQQQTLQMGQQTSNMSSGLYHNPAMSAPIKQEPRSLDVKDGSLTALLQQGQGEVKVEQLGAQQTAALKTLMELNDAARAKQATQQQQASLQQQQQQQQIRQLLMSQSASATTQAPVTAASTQQQLKLILQQPAVSAVSSPAPAVQQVKS